MTARTYRLRELGKRATRAPRWRWMEGMQTTDDDRVVAVAHDGAPMVSDPFKDPLPNLEDPATEGCVVALLREVYDDETVCLSYVFDGLSSQWAVIGMGEWLSAAGSRAEALVAALEAAP